MGLGRASGWCSQQLQPELVAAGCCCRTAGKRARAPLLQHHSAATAVGLWPCISGSVSMGLYLRPWGCGPGPVSLCQWACRTNGLGGCRFESPLQRVSEPHAAHAAHASRPSCGHSCWFMGLCQRAWACGPGAVGLCQWACGADPVPRTWASATDMCSRKKGFGSRNSVSCLPPTLCTQHSCLGTPAIAKPYH